MVDVNKLLGQILNSSQGKSLAGGLLVGGLAGALTGKTGQKMATTALKLGGVAAVAGLAYNAYQNYQQQQYQTGGARRLPDTGGYQPRIEPRQTIEQRADDIVDVLPPADSGYLPQASDAPATDALALKLIRAMIAAAKADGRIDPHESRKIMGQVDALGFSGEEKSFLLTEIAQPLTAHEIAASAASTTEAEEIFAVSVMAIDSNGAAERSYLNNLAGLLRLDPSLARAIHDRVAAA